MLAETRKPRVAIYRSEMLPLSETFIHSQITGLRTWEPVLVGRKYVKDGLPLQGIETCCVPSPSTRAQRLAESVRFWLNRPIPELANAFQNLGVDLVHVHFGTEATTVWPSVRAAGLPLLVTLHGKDINIHPEWWESGQGGLRRRIYPKRLMQLADEPGVRFLAVSKALRHHAIRSGIPAEKVSVSYVGVDTERFEPRTPTPEQRNKRILFIGRMVEKKAPLLLIRAFAHVRSKLPDAELVMVGAGHLLEEARHLARNLDLPVIFPGALTANQVLAELHQARVFCLPSLTAENGDAEGFGLVLLEAQACGVPSVSSALGGATEGIVDRVTGFSFSENDLPVLEARLLQILVDDDLCLAMSRQARNFVVENFDIKNCVKVVESQYASLVRAHLKG